MVKKSLVLLAGLFITALSACTVNVFLPPNPATPPVATDSQTTGTPGASAMGAPSPNAVGTGATASVASAPTPTPVQTPNFLPSPSVSPLPFATPLTPPELPSLPPPIAPTIVPSLAPAPSSSSSFSFGTPIPTPALASPSPGLTPTPLPTVNPDPRTYSATIVLTASKSAIFTPSVFSLNQGDTITWKNVFNTGQTLLSPDQLFGDQYLMPGASFSYTFTKAGKYRFNIRLATGSQGVVVK